MAYEDITEKFEKIKNKKIKDIIVNSINTQHVEGIALRYLLVDKESCLIYESLCQSLNSWPDIWKISSKDYWLIQIAYCYLHNDKNEAIKLLKEYTKIYGNQDIKYYLTVSYIAYKQNISSDLMIEKSAKLYLYMKKNDRLFESIIKNKSIAIVGNGPSENGLKKGKIIDSHDLVIRFNNYITNGFSDDYGMKTDIWIRGFGGEDIEDKSLNTKFKYIGWSGDYKYIRILNDNMLKILYRDCIKRKLKCSFVDSDMYYDVVSKCGERLPTTGCTTIYTVYKYMESTGSKLSINDIYGFSFLCDNKDESFHYYNDRTKKEDIEKSKNHNIDNESDFLKKLFFFERRPKNVKIAVCYHKPANLIQNEVFLPLNVGRKVNKLNSKDGKLTENTVEWLNRNMIGDDTGDNISIYNRNYCELTGMYWMWKNQDKISNPEYLGLMHYRRVFQFEKDNQLNYCPKIEDIKSICGQADIIVANKLPAYSQKLKKNIDTIYEHFAIEHSTKEIDILYETVKTECPDKIRALKRVLFESPSISWYNIIIAYKEVFDDYCTWLFEILNKLNIVCETQGINTEKSRLMGFYGEILLNVYVEWVNEYQREKRIMRLNSLKVTESQLYNFPYVPIDASLNNKIKAYIAKHDYDFKYKNIYLLVHFLNQKRHEHLGKKIECVHSLTYRDYYPDGGAGGGGAVLSCQKELMGDWYQDVKLMYTFKEKNYYLDYSNPLWDIWAAAQFAIEKTKKERNTVYITHDYGVAFGLALMGKRYALISHIQGCRVEEKTNFGEKFSEIDKKIICFCEKYAFTNAHQVCFPSIGAKEHFEKSKYKRKFKYHEGDILYNTLYAFPQKQLVEKIKEDKSSITFLSIGQLTYSKGIDQVIEFLEDYMERNLDKKVRLIIIGNGILKKSIITKCVELRNRYRTFRFSHMDKCSYMQMQYIQSISDIYIMLQRISIFDLSTLEMMSKGKMIILSSTGGNREFNRENNILFSDENVFGKINMENIKTFGRRNQYVFKKYFSQKSFCMSYGRLIEKLLGRKNKSEIENQYLITNEIYKMLVELKEERNE